MLCRTVDIAGTVTLLYFPPLTMGRRVQPTPALDDAVALLASGASPRVCRLQLQCSRNVSKQRASKLVLKAMRVVRVLSRADKP